MKRKILLTFLALALCLATLCVCIAATEEGTDTETTVTVLSSGQQPATGTPRFSWELTSDGVLRFIKGSDTSVSSNNTYTAFSTWRANTVIGEDGKVEDYVKHIVFDDGFTTLMVQHANRHVLAKWPLLETIYLGNINRIDNSYAIYGIFEGNENLTKVYNANTASENNGDGIVNLEKVGQIRGAGGTSYYGRYTRNMFYGCDKITKVVFYPKSTPSNSNGTTIIYDNAFANCTSLTEVTIPAWATQVRASILSGSPNVKSITFPANVTSVYADVLKGSSVTTVTFENSAIDVSAINFPTTHDIVINCASKAQYDAIAAKGLTNLQPVFEIAPGNLMSDGSGYQYAYDNGVMTITKADTTSTTTLSSDITLDFKADVTTIVIGEDTGITALGANIFDGFAAETVVIPSTLTTIGAASFANMPNLKTVVDHTAYTADNTAGSGIINIMTATSVAADAFSGSCVALAPVVYMGKTVAISGETFAWFAEDATETIYVYPSTSATTFFRDNSIAFEYLTVDQTGDALLAREYSDWVFDTETGKLTWDLGTGHLNVGKNATAWPNWKAVWKDAIQYFFVENGTTSGCYVFYQWQDSPFSNLPNLKHVHMGRITVLRRSSYGTNGLFSGCTSLTTVSYGDDSTYDEVIDLAWWKKNDYMMKSMFYNCASIKKVIMPENLKKYDAESSSEIGIFSSMFQGCTNLEEVDVSECFISFYGNAFKGCTSLKKIVINSLPYYYDLTAFPDQEGLTIEVANEFVASLFEDYNFTLTTVAYPEGEANSYFVEVAQPTTNIIGDLSAIREVSSADELNEVLSSETPAAAVLVDIDSSLNVIGLDITVEQLLTALDYRIFAAFRVSDSATVTALNTYLTSIGFFDAYVVGSPALVAESYALNYMLHHIVDYSDTYTTALTTENCNAIRAEAYTSGAKMVVLPYSACTKDNLDYLYSRSVTVWIEMPETATVSDNYAAILSGAIGVITDETDEVLDIACNVLPEKTLTRVAVTSGHRGNETVCPENTLEGCLYAVNHGAQSVEIDVYITTDGHVVLMHDGDTARTCNGDLDVEKSTLAQLKELYVNKGFEDHELYSQCRIPTLREIFEALKDYDVLINIEFKSTKEATVDAVIALIEEYDMYDKTCFSTFRYDQFKRMHDKYPQTHGIMLFRDANMLDYSADLNSLYVKRTSGNYNANVSLYNNAGGAGNPSVAALLRRGVPVQSWSGTGLKVKVESGMHMIGDGYAYFPNSLYVDGVSSSVAPGTSETLVASYKDYYKALNEATGVTYRIIDGASLATIDPETGVITYGAEAGSVSFVAEYKYLKEFTTTTVEYTVASDVYTVEISSDVTDDTIRGNFLSDGTGFGYELDGDVLTVVADLTTSGSVLSKDVSLDFSSSVKTIIIPDVTEITEIAANMFEDFAAETVVIPSTLTTVGSKAFAGMTNLKTVVPYAAYVSDNTAGSGAINLLTVTSFADDAFEKSASSQSVSVLFAKNAPVPGEGFAWFDSDTTVTYYTYPTCNIAKYFRDNEIDFKYLTEEQTGDALLSREAATTVMSWVFDEELGRLTLTRSDGSALSFTASTSTTWQNWKNTWSDAIEEFYLNMSHWRIYYQKHDSPFSNLKNLKHIHFNRTTLRLDRSTTGTNGLFQNCTSLTTISYGTDDTYDEVIDLGCWSTQDAALTSMFYGCSSIKKVILPPTVKKNDADDPDVSIASSFFRNCTSLTEVEIPANFLSISSNAFAGCTNLKYVKILGELPNGVNATAFPDQEGLTIDVPSYNVAVKFDACNFTKTKIVYPFNGIVAMNGFSVRLTGYNGLRGLFTADWTKIAEYNEAGYELLDFGTLVSSAANRANCVLTGEYGNYTVAGNVVNTPIWNKTDGIVGKYLTSSDDALEFAVTVVNFAESQYMSNVYFCAYEIWKNPEGEIEILYKDCDGTDYDEMSLARMCSIMYEDGIITEENDTEGMVKDLADHYEENRTKNILFIGNSFTYYNDMPTAIFPVVAKAAGKDVNVTAITNGGHTLEKFASSTDTYGAKVAEAFKNNSYDIVIIQEQSHRPISNPESFYAAARDLKEMARQNGAETYLYATWGYDADHSSLSTYGKDTADMEMKLRAAYEYIGSELNIPVCHVGAAMTYAFTNSDVSLYQSDNYHPLKTGSTLAAMTIASKIYGFDPASINLTIDGITAENMSALKAAASYVYNNDMSVPEEYKTSSENPLDGKRIIFIGNSHIYYGCTVMHKSPDTVWTQAARDNDDGYFYQLCKANGMDVDVTNWTFSNHVFSNLFGGVCSGTSNNYDCAGQDHASYLVDPYYDYVVACYGTTGNPAYAGVYDKMIDFFKDGNPNVKMYLMAQASAHGVHVKNAVPDFDFLATLKTWEDKGVTVIDWGKLIADLVSGEAKVPGATLDYNMNTFVVSQSSSDGFHPNQLTGYITTLMTYCMLTGESAVGQPYNFVGDDSYSSNSYYRTFEEYITAYYKNGATTNYDQVFASETDMLGIQTLVDEYIAAKHYENYAPERAIFIGDSFVYYGNAVVNEPSSMTQASRSKDEGYFYQLCKANGRDVNVTNWTFGSHGIGTIRSDSCTISGCDGNGTSHMANITNPYYDYVIISGGRASTNTFESMKANLEWYVDFFRSANPNVKFYYLVSSGAHNISVAESFPIEILNNLDEFEKLGFTIIDWGKLVADIINGDVTVPGATLEYNKDSFVVNQTSADGYHPNQLAGYITSLMTYHAIYGESAVGQPYDFCGNKSFVGTSATNYLTFDKYVSTYYKNGATTNYPEIFASEADMTGIQTLVDQYFAAKAFRDYDFQ